MCQVLKWLNQFQFNANQWIININMRYILLHFYIQEILAYGLNVEPRNLVFLRTCNTELDDMTITFIGQNGEPLEIENKLNLILLINKQK